LGALAENLNDVRRRLRKAARVEVARAVGDALRDFALTVICGPSRYGIPRYVETSTWNDPWDDDSHDAWTATSSFREPEESTGQGSVTGGLSIQAAIILSVGAARWGYLRTRHVVIAVLIGAAVAIVVLAGGPTVDAFVAAWMPAQDLLNHHGRNFPT
jgi:hypothetical protein